MADFTKGKWYVEQVCGPSIEVTTDHWDYLNIGIVTEGEDCCNNPEALANAHLIAAAPEMYAMIEMLANELYQAVDECNDQRLSHITSMTETPPDLIDMESIHLAQLLLKKARGG